MRKRHTTVLQTTVGILLAIGINVISLADEGSEARQQFTFSYQFLEDGAMSPRGGTTVGAPVTLITDPTADWQALQEPGITEFERDRRAILAMAGGYRTTFDFIETVRFIANAKPRRPYQSWATEYVYVAADEGEFISLQHMLVMVFVDENGNLSEPMVQKHWRQDWHFEDTDLHVYAGHNVWERHRLSPEAASGSWTQAVFQVDDAPRYESVGRWTHNGNYSSWVGDPTWRPLPRRESSVRDDYDVLEAVNRHTIVPTGWVHEENNLKLDIDDNGEPVSAQPYLAREQGVNRYERIDDFDFSAGDSYWEATADFWSDVRLAWASLLETQDRFALQDRVEGRSLFEHMFLRAAEIHDLSRVYDEETDRAFIDSVLESYVVPL